MLFSSTLPGLFLLFVFTMGGAASAIPAAFTESSGTMVSSTSLPSVGNTEWIRIKGDELQGCVASRMIVGVWTNLRWAELPFIALPLRNNTYTTGLRILYHGRPLRTLGKNTASYVLRNLDKLVDRGEAKVLKAFITLYAQPVKINPRQGILVPLTKDLLAKASRTSEQAWAPEALRLGYDRRLTYNYNGVGIEVYCSSSRTGSRTPLLPPLTRGTKLSIYAGIRHNGRIRNVRLLDQLDPQELYKQYTSQTTSLSPSIRLDGMPKAKLLRVEKLSTSNLMLSSGAYLWYVRYWRDGVLSNHTVMGQENVVLVDYFTTKGNTSRYDIYLKLRSLANTGRTIHVEAYVNGSQVICDDLVEDGRSTYMLEATISGREAEISNKAWEVKVVLSGLDPQESKWLVDAVATARAWIQPINWENGVHEVHAQYYGTSSVSYTGSQDDRTPGQYEINPESGDAILLFAGSSNLVEGYSGTGLSITVKSTSDQLYDRYVDIYVGDHYLGSCLASAPVANGTRGVRSCTLQADDISPYLIGSLRRNETLAVRVAIRGYNSHDYRHWFINEAYVNFYMRETLETRGLYDVKDPTLVTCVPPGCSTDIILEENYIGGSYYYYGYWLDTDMHQSLITVSIPKFMPGAMGKISVAIIIPIMSRRPASQEYMSHSLVRAEIQLSLSQEGTNVKIAQPPGAYIPVPQASSRYESSTIRWGLRIASVISNLIGVVVGEAAQLESEVLLLGIGIATAPSSYRYEEVASLKQVGSNAVRLAWDSGYRKISSGLFMIGMVFMPGLPTGVWNANPLNISLSGYLRIYVSKEAPNDSPIVPSSLLDVSITRSMESMPGAGG